MDEVSLSIVIVNWNVRDLLRACLQSVQQQMRLPETCYEVIVVDNQSTDGSVAMLEKEFPGVRLIANPHNPGFGKANNQALPLCRGKYILLLNPDTVILDHALDKMLARMEGEPSIGALGCRLLNGDGTLQRWTGGSFPTLWTVACHYFFLSQLLPRGFRPASLYLDSDVPSSIDVDWVSGACLLLRREEVGDYIFDDAFFMYGEDMELCHRLKKAGQRVVYMPEVSIIHYQGASMKQQKGEVLLTSLKGLRSFYARVNGPAHVWAVDWITIIGFLLRWAAYRAASIVRPGGGYAERARSSLSYASMARRIMAGS
ncbi:MAG: glycosyltransferase family 2 protein [Planctomycetota bacterium]